MPVDCFEHELVPHLDAIGPLYELRIMMSPGSDRVRVWAPPGRSGAAPSADGVVPTPLQSRGFAFATFTERSHAEQVDAGHGPSGADARCQP